MLFPPHLHNLPVNCKIHLQRCGAFSFCCTSRSPRCPKRLSKNEMQVCEGLRPRDMGCKMICRNLNREGPATGKWRIYLREDESGYGTSISLFCKLYLLSHSMNYDIEDREEYVNLILISHAIYEGKQGLDCRRTRYIA